MTDLILVSEDQRQYQAHRVILSSVSPVLRGILTGLASLQSPVLFMRGVKGEDLQSLLHFIYNGTVDLDQDRVEKVLQLMKEFKLDEVFNINEFKDEKELVTEKSEETTVTSEENLNSDLKALNATTENVEVEENKIKVKETRKVKKPLSGE